MLDTFTAQALHVHVKDASANDSEQVYTSGQMRAHSTSVGMSAMRPRPVMSTESTSTNALSGMPSALFAPAGGVADNLRVKPRKCRCTLSGYVRDDEWKEAHL